MRIKINYDQFRRDRFFLFIYIQMFSTTSYWETQVFKFYSESWILSRGEPTKISKIVREMVEEYVYLETPSNSMKSHVRLVSIPSKPVDDETLYFDLPEKYEDDKVC